MTSNISKILFITIPKTGSNTIHSYMNDNITKQFNHQKALIINNILLSKNDSLSNYETYVFIRNPIDLVKSWYFYHKYSPNVIRQDVKDFYPNSFNEWCFDMNFKTHWENDNHLKYNPKWDKTNPLHQYKWIYDDDDNIIVKNVFKFDNIDNILMDLFKCDKINIKNKSEKDKYLIDNKCINEIKKKFKKDFELYNSL